MTHHDHHDHGHHGSHDHKGHQHPPRKGLHKDWRAWVVVILMLAAMAAYILSDNERFAPGGGVGPAMPEAAE